MSRRLKEKAKVKRYLKIFKVFLVITPFICCLYISLKQAGTQFSFQAMLQQYPSLCVIFLIAMVNPFIAYLIQFIEKDLDNNKDQNAICNMILLLFAQALTLNTLYFMAMAYLFYRLLKCYQLSFKDFDYKHMNRSLLLATGGSWFVIFISSLSLFATLRLA